MRGGKEIKDSKLRLHCTENLLFPLPLSKYLQSLASTEGFGDSSLQKDERDRKIGLIFPVLGLKL